MRARQCSVRSAGDTAKDLMIKQRALEILKQKEFVSIGTADKQGYPNAAPKLLLKIENGFVYLIDYTIAKTAANLKENPVASLSFMDIDNLVGYRLDGQVLLISEGNEYNQILIELEKKLIKLSASRVIEASRTGKKNKHYELEIPDKILVLKIEIKQVVKIGSQGDLWREES